jgi:hypothetical protein
LANGKKVPSTAQWNPLVFALVLGKHEVYNFIVKQVNFNLIKLLEFDALTSISDPDGLGREDYLNTEEKE